MQSWGITGPGDHYIAPERRCEPCGALLGSDETSPCEKCAPTPRKQRGATKAQLEYRERLFGVSGGATRGQFLTAVQGMVKP